MPLIHIIQQKTSGKGSSSPAYRETAKEWKWHMNALKVEDMAALGAIGSILLNWDITLTHLRFVQHLLHVGRIRAMAYSFLLFTQLRGFRHLFGFRVLPPRFVSPLSDTRLVLE